MADPQSLPGSASPFFRTKRALTAVALSGWILGVGYGLATLWSYQNAPGQSARAPATWPGSSRIPAPHARPAVVMLLHPQCVCSDATVAELGRLVARTRDAADIYLLFLNPPGVSDDWTHSDLWRTASKIPGVRVLQDEGGIEARRFGASTSGETLVYDKGGRLRFSGGITASRGHEGDNAGRSAVESILLRDSGRSATPTFGCALFGHSG